MGSNLPVAEILARLETKIAYHKEQGEVHARQEAVHAEQRALHEAEHRRAAIGRHGADLHARSESDDGATPVELAEKHIVPVPEAVAALRKALEREDR